MQDDGGNGNRRPIPSITTSLDLGSHVSNCDRSNQPIRGQQLADLGTLRNSSTFEDFGVWRQNTEKCKGEVLCPLALRPSTRTLSDLCLIKGTRR
jgi:hypothetical protein